MHFFAYYPQIYLIARAAVHRAECISFFKVSAVRSEMDCGKLKRALLQLKLPRWRIFSLSAAGTAWHLAPGLKGLK